MPVGFASLHSPYALDSPATTKRGPPKTDMDSRRRGNDRIRGMQRGSAPLPRVWGCHPTPYFPPKTAGAWGVGMNRSHVVTVQQDAAGVWGVPNSLLLPQEWGIKGVEDSHANLGNETDRDGATSY